MNGRQILLTIGAILILVGLVGEWGSLPRLASFFSPFDGFWYNMERIGGGLNSPLASRNQNLKLPGLKGEVSIYFDQRMVPHIFAENEYDLFYAQGYVTAALRLWQMDIQTRAAGGELSEILGPKFLNHDRLMRRIGMRYGAEQALKGMDSTSKMIIQAYTNGVNAYISSLSPREYPVEYKIMGFSPKRWSPFRTALLLKMMAWDLSGTPDDLILTSYALRYGKKEVDSLFPDVPYFVDPIIPKEEHFDFTPLNVPYEPPADSSLFESWSSFFGSFSPFEKGAKEKGSNNWVVSGKKSITGYPILANDPHLRLSLPSIWMEIHLQAPSYNVYGVSLPGAPCVIIGFNENIAWGLTNVHPDIMDQYALHIKDSLYQWQGKWLPLQTRIETIEVKGQNPLLDTVYYTHIGPIPFREFEKPLEPIWGQNLALRWTAHLPSNELKTFYLLNKGKQYQDYVEALRYFTCPAQNFIYADTLHIALTSTGKYPLKWRGQGKYVLSGNSVADDWHGWIPFEHLPQAKNPRRYFLSSANQHPSPNYPYYLGADFASFARGKRINDVLSSDKLFSVEDFQRLQLDTKNEFASFILPTLLELIDTTQLASLERTLLDTLRQWDYFHTTHSYGATLFDAFWNDLVKLIWNDELKLSGTVVYPSRDVTAYFLRHRLQEDWIDNRKTKERETVQEIVTRAYQLAVKRLVTMFGYPVNPKWRWAWYKHTQIPHLARLKGFGYDYVEVGGAKGIVNATGATHGPSWRMIVQLGTQVKGYGIYPGGQSGNPGSPYYDNMVMKWAEGKLDTLLFPVSETDFRSQKVRAVMEWKAVPTVR